MSDSWAKSKGRDMVKRGAQVIYVLRWIRFFRALVAIMSIHSDWSDAKGYSGQ